MDSIAIYFSDESDCEDDVSPHLRLRAVRDKSNIFDIADAQ